MSKRDDLLARYDDLYLDMCDIDREIDSLQEDIDGLEANRICINEAMGDILWELDDEQ